MIAAPTAAAVVAVASCSVLTPEARAFVADVGLEVAGIGGVLDISPGIGGFKSNGTVGSNDGSDGAAGAGVLGSPGTAGEPGNSRPPLISGRSLRPKMLRSVTLPITPSSSIASRELKLSSPHLLFSPKKSSSVTTTRSATPIKYTVRPVGSLRLSGLLP